MNNLFEKNAGLSLIIFTVLGVCTMMLHPVGGNMSHLIRITNAIVITHAVAILSLPFGWVGFWGLTRKIGAEQFDSAIGFAMGSFGLLAIMVAATANGLIMAIFLHQYRDAGTDTLAAIKPVLHYSAAMNHAFDYIYTAMICLAILCWSVAILRTRKMTGWIGWLGIALSIATAGILASGVAVNSLLGLRIFAGGMVTWILLVGIILYRQEQHRRS